MKRINIKWTLVAYDVLIFTFVELFLQFLYDGYENLSTLSTLVHFIISLICIFTARFIGKIYSQIWRYGGIQSYLRFLLVDGCSFVINYTVSFILSKVFTQIQRIPSAHLIAICSLTLLFSMSIRMIYRYIYKRGKEASPFGKFLRCIFKLFAGSELETDFDAESKIKIAIIGADSIGVSLANELVSNKNSVYVPKCFVDIDTEKAGRVVHNMPVFMFDENILYHFNQFDVQEVVFAINSLPDEARKKQYDFYLKAGYKIKTYDYPRMQSEVRKRHLRDFDIEDLLFRKQVEMTDESTKSYYKDKVILITGGGGSIGSELCRQLAKFGPKQIIILDIYESGAYDVQQELKFSYGNKLDLQIEICSITNKKAISRVFEKYHPEIVINAAAHKHVPLMENNCIEAVENNVFGCKNLVDACEEFGTERFMMVSTDKAVNPTNVMGATKRMCEMIVQSASTYGKVKYSSTRFGNVLGSAGSVIPLFKRQIANGGPITITDKRIIRYFMTIPEASQLVLQSGAMANNGELFVLDMGQPVRIYDLAENMIRLSGISCIEIVEIGLRPGEKLYEELLVKTEELDKTSNSLIFIERDKPLDRSEIDVKLAKLEKACLTGDDNYVRDVLKEVVPTFKSAEEVNKNIKSSEEAKSFVLV